MLLFRKYIDCSYHTFSRTHQTLTEYISCGTGELAIWGTGCIAASSVYRIISAGSCSGSGYIVGVAGSGPVGLHLQKFEARYVKFARGVCSMSTKGSTCQHKVKEFYGYLKIP